MISSHVARTLLLRVLPLALAIAPLSLAFVALGCAPSDSDDDSNDRRDPIPPGDCVPATCDELGINCGDALDGCGGVVTCGLCADGETCGAAGPNVCGLGSCTATTCDAVAAQCGLLSDNCSAVLTCGTCGDGEVCSSSYTCCTPTHSCDSEDAECGTVDDGCGNPLACGSCPDGQNCGANGPGQCGIGECTPRTCDDIDAECGAPSDGCDSTLECGECPAYLVCGATADNQCGAVCADDCPNGYTCDALGVCDGGGLTGVVLDVDVPAFVSVHGTVTMNGADVELPEFAERGCVDISFQNLDDGESASSYACSDTNWEYDVQLYVGHYTITVVDDYYSPTMLTSIPFVVEESRNITSAGTINLDVDVPAFVAVHGTVTMNGGDVQLPELSERGCVDISFQNLDGGESASSYACSDTNWEYSVQLYVGHYTITVVDDYYSPTMLTAIPFTVEANRNVTSAGTINLDVDVPAFVAVHGTVTMNGGDVQLPELAERGCVDISFQNLDDGESGSSYACSDTNWEYSVQLYVGHYTITVVDDYYSPTMLTSIPFTVETNKNVTSAGTINLDVDVPAFVAVHGTVTMNGGDVELPELAERGCVDISFQNLDGGEGASSYACSDTNWEYSVQLYVGHYTITVVDDYYSPTMLTAIPFTVEANKNVTSAGTINLDVDVPAFVAVHGTVTMNGGDVELPEFAERGCVDISFQNLDGGEGASSYACSDTNWEYSVQLYVGHYTITVVDDYYSPTMLTSIPFTVEANKNVTSAGTIDLDVDVPPYVDASGTVKMNGGVVQLPELAERGCVDISFQNLEGGESASSYACSDTNWAWSAQLYAGIYRVVVVDDYYSPTMLTAIPQTVIERVRFE